MSEFGQLDPALVDDEEAEFVPMKYESASQRYQKKWKIGDVTVTKIVEWEGAEVLTYMVSQATRETIKSIDWLHPHFATQHGLCKVSVHALVIDTPTRRIIVDTCIGANKDRQALPAFHHMQTTFLEDLSAAGFPPESIDVVLCTHLHVDHVGWNTMLVEGEWQPTFANARYLFSKKEYDYWTAGTDITAFGWDVTQHETFVDSVKPVFDAGLVDFIEAPHRVCDEVRLVPTSGHSPGHVSALIESGGQRAFITGDIVHHPCQIAHPEWGAAVDHDPIMATATRARVFGGLADKPVLVIGTHFAGPSAGFVHPDGEGFRLDVEE